MFLKKVKSKFSQISYRLGLTYLLFFIPCYLITFGVFYAWTIDFLETRDRDLIDSRIVQYQEILEKEGIEGLKNIYTDTKNYTGAAKYLLEATDLSGKVLFFHMSEGLGQKFVNVEEQLKQSLSLQNAKWFFIESSDHDKDAIEVKTIVVNNQFRLNIGASTNDRDELLEKFQAIFLTIIFPLLIASFFFSIFIAQKFLKPISNLSDLIKEVKGGDLSQRATLPYYKDELYDLTVGFNKMLTQIEFLIEAMKDTLDNVAHDLSTPISRARIASELALKSGNPTELKLAAEESIENLDNIQNMIQTIMTMSGLNSKTFSLKKEKFNASVIIEEIVELYIFVAEEKHITLTVDCDSKIEVYADRHMIKQALANLLDNAIKYSLANTQVKLSCRKQNDQIEFVVEDQGMGISADDIPRIWERLFRSDKSRHEKGFGLGLSLVKIFIESNNGTVGVESNIGSGSAFTISLPVAKS